MQMLLDGKSLHFRATGEVGNDRKVTLATLHSKIADTPIKRLFELMVTYLDRKILIWLLHHISDYDIFKKGRIKIN